MGNKHIVPFLFGIFITPVSVYILKPSYIYQQSVLGMTIIASPTPTHTPTPTTTPIPTPTSTPFSTKKPIPTRTPTPSPIPITSAQLDEWFTKYSNHYSIEHAKLRRMAVCESNLKPNATNGDYGGLYQFSTRTWKSTRQAMNADPNPTLRFNPEEAIKTAAFKISTMGLSPWPNCNK